MAAFIQANPNPQHNANANATVARSLNDRYAHYRVGIPWDPNQRQPIYDTHDVPFTQGPWLGIDLQQDFQPIGQPAMPRDVSPQGGNYWGQYNLQAFLAGDNGAASQHVANRMLVLAGLLNPQFPNPPQGPGHYNYVKILGWGGNGVAALFKENRPGIHRYHVVKTSLSGIPGLLQTEQANMRQFPDYPHIIQETHQPNPQVIMMAYSKRGTLGKVLGATQQLASILGQRAHDRHGVPLNQEPDAFSDRLLWHFFDCLLQGVIALRYPPGHWWANQQIQPNHNEVMPSGADMAGVAPRYNEVPNNGGWVHFDIDPSNVLLFDPHYDLESGQGPPLLQRLNITPTLTLSDFDSAEWCGSLHAPMVPVPGQDPWPEAWACRGYGKDGWYIPEQFTSEWNHMPVHPLPPRLVAGEYRDWTNLYGVASVMWSLITRRYPHLSPQPRKYDKLRYWNAQRADDQLERRHVYNLPLHWATIPRRTWSYGCYLLDTVTDQNGVTQERYGNFGARLRHLIVRCMSDNPRHRPRLPEIRGEIDRWIRPQRWRGRRDRQSDARLREEVRRCVIEYPAGRTPSNQRLRRWWLGQISMP